MKISDSFSNNLKVLLTKIENLDYELCLVGGAVRDFLISNQVGHDLDFEIRKKNPVINTEHLLQDLIDLFRKEKINVEKLPYNIIRIKIENFDLEFSPPRIEVFQSNLKSHHNFTPNLDFNLKYEDSFLRRDFTINSIGIVISLNNNVRADLIIDPFDGITDLKNKILKTKNPNFYQDPVRFLRLIRFHLKLNFSFDKSIEVQLRQFDLTEISHFHFWREVFKVDAGHFLNLFSKLVIDHQIRIDSKLVALLKEDYPIHSFDSKQDFVFYHYFKSPLKIKEIASICSLSEKTIDGFDLFYKSFLFIIRNFESLNIEEQNVFYLDDDLMIFLKALKAIDQNKEYLPYLKFSSSTNLNLPFNLNDLTQIVISSDELKQMKPEFRSFLKYYKFLVKSKR